MSRAPFNLDPPGAVSFVDPNSGAESANAGQVDVKVAGGSNLYLADASVPGTLYWFGEQIDDTSLVIREFFNDIPGDSQGGPQGPPIDRQVLGRIVQVSFTLSTWSQRVRFWLERQNTAYFTNGAIEDYEVGAPLFSDHAFRLLIIPARNNKFTAGAPTNKSQDWFTYNFPTAVLSSPIEWGQGTKFSTLSFTMEAHRSPPGTTKRGVIWDRDIDGLSEAVSSLEAQATEQYEAILAERAKTAPITE